MNVNGFKRNNVNQLFENVTFADNGNIIELHDVTGTIYDCDMRTFCKAIKAMDSRDFENLLAMYKLTHDYVRDIKNGIMCSCSKESIANRAFECGMHARFMYEESKTFAKTWGNDVAATAYRILEFMNHRTFYSFDTYGNDIKW